MSGTATLGSKWWTSRIAEPMLIDSVATPTVARGVAISGAYAYVADYHSGLLVIDISDPFNSQIVASVDTPHEAWDVALAGHYAYVADGRACRS